MKALFNYTPLIGITVLGLSFLSLSAVFETNTSLGVDGTATESLAPEMIPVPAGTFRMGDNFGDGGPREKPSHLVTMSAFEIGKYELTFSEYDRFCTATKRELPRDERWGREVRCACRQEKSPGKGNFTTGFRLARTAS